MRDTNQRPSVLRKLSTLGAAAALAVSGTLIAAAPAHAATANCASSLTCLYSGYDYGNDWAQNPSTRPFGRCIDDLRNYAYNDKASSVFNNGQRDAVYLFEDSFKKGAHRYFVRGTGTSNLGSISFNDKISSAYFESLLGSVGTSTCK